jgi:hypothetical protein
MKLKDYEILPKDVNLDELIKIWTHISLEYGQAEDSNSSIIHYTRSKSIHKMELEYLMYWNIINMMTMFPNHEETIKTLKYAGLPKDQDPEKLKKKLKGLKNRIELKRKDLKDETEGNEKIDFYRILDQIEDIKNRTINPFTTTVRQYIAIKKNIKNGKRQNTAKGRNRS